MKTVLLAIAFLAATATAADVCELKCSSQNGSWNGNSSVVVNLGGGVELAYDVEYELLVIVNTNVNIAVAVNGNFIVFLNIQTGGAVVVDISTGYAIYIKIEVNFKNSDGSINYTKLVAQIQVIISRYTSITSSTSGSFNFQLIIIAFYSGQFDLSVIFEGNAQLVKELQASFSVLFRLLQQAIVSGSLSVAEGLWGFVVVVIEIDIRISIAIVQVFRISVEYYRRIEIEFVVAFVRTLSLGVSALEQFAIKLSDYLSVTVNASLSSVISYVENVSNNPVSVNITINGSSYALIVTRIDSIYVLRLSIQSSSGHNLDVKLVLLGDVLLIYNLNTSIAVALYRNYIVAVNVTSDLVIVAKWSFLGGLSGNLVTSADLQQDVLKERYSKIEAVIKALVKLYSSHGAFRLSALAVAVQSGSVEKVAKVVGSAKASEVLKLYGGFFGQATSSSVGGIVVGVFGNRRSAFSFWFAQIVDVQVKSSGVISWSSVIGDALHIRGSSSSGSEDSGHGESGIGHGGHFGTSLIGGGGGGGGGGSLKWSSSNNGHHH